MFALRVEPTPGRAWALDGREGAPRLVAGPSFVEPYAHPMVQMYAVRCGGLMGCGIVEQPLGSEAASGPSLTDGTMQDFDSAREATRRWPLHWFWIEVTADAVTIEAGPLAGVPVFVAQSGTIALAHWDATELLPRLRPALDEAFAVHFLCDFEQPYGFRTVLEGCLRVAGGHRARWSRGSGWHVALPDPFPFHYPRVLAKNTDPVGAFSEMLEAILRRSFPASATKLAGACSGRLDSTAVLLAARRAGCDVRGYGVVLPGSSVSHQLDRRDAASRAAGGGAPVLIDATDEPDWAAPSSRLRSGMCLPWEELNYDLFDALYARAAADGQRVFLTGFGGDELMAPYWDEVPVGAHTPEDLPIVPGLLRSGDRRMRKAALGVLPRAYVQSSVLDAVAGDAAQHLRHGLWPVHPLATPELVAFCRSLPKEWREGRRLVRAALERAGVARCVVHPTEPDSFSQVTLRPLHDPRTDALLAAPILADLGWVEPKRLRSSLDDWRGGRGPESWGLQFIAIAQLEGLLAGMARRSASSPPRIADAPAGGAGQPEVLRLRRDR